MPAGRPSTYTEEKIYIYKLYSPLDGIPMYIGKTINPAKRLTQHRSLSKHLQTKVARWVKDLAKQGVKAEMEVICCVLCDWEEVEKQVIAQYREDYDLLNQASGGNQPQLHNSGTKKRLRELHQKLGILLRHGHVSDKTKEKLRRGAALYPDIMGRYADV